MRRIKNYELDRQVFDRPILMYTDKDGMHRVEVNAKDKDEIEVFRDGEATYVVSWNTRLGYVGLERFVGHEKTGEIFLQNSQDVEACLGRRGLDLTPMSMVKRLVEYVT